jgi:peptide/nickel transport system substrate-binding protein
VFKAKENWWGGPVCIKDLTVTFIGDTVAAYEAFRKNEVQIFGMNRDPETQDKAVKENPGRVKGQFNNSAFMLLPNIRAGGYTGPFSDVRARLAAAYALDADLINNRALGGKGLPGKGIINAKTTTLSATNGLPYDPNRARELLNQVKTERNWDGSTTAICAETPASNKEACITVAALLNNVGFRVNLSTVPTGVLIQQVIVQKRFDLVASWGIINPEYELWRGFSAWDTRNALNYNGYDNQQYDAILDRMQAAPNKAEYQRAANDLQDLVNKEVPWAIYGATEDVTIWKENVRGLEFTNFAPLLDKAYLAK